MATFQSLTINDTGSLLLPRGEQQSRPGNGVYQFLNTGSTTWTCPAGVTTVQYLVVAGGGGGGSGVQSANNGGGGGAGGFLTGNLVVTPGNTYTITVGGGGAPNTNGSNSSISGSDISSVIAIGGGGGGGRVAAPNGVPGQAGGSGGGGGPASPTTGGLGTAGQGNNGAAGNPASPYHGGGGGGAGGAGVTVGGTGGVGLQSSITGSLQYYAGGGGGGADTSAGVGGLGGGGTGGLPNGAIPTSGVANTGGGGGGGASQGTAIPGASGGSGIVVIKQNVPLASSSMIRFNTTSNKIENYNGSIWKIAGSPSNQWLYYDESVYAQAYTANWNSSTTFYMANFGGLGPVAAHGHTASGTFTLTLNNLPPHNYVMYKVFWHCVDSVDTETSYLYLTNSSGTETEFFRFTKAFGTDGFSAVVLQSGASAFWSGSQTYSYAPWPGGSVDGYITFNSGLYSHTSTSFSARHVFGADQTADDEAMYLSHVQLWLGS